MSDSPAWGRVDEQGTVFVRTADGEREVGQFPDASPEEALAYYERKFADLAGQVTLLEQRAKRGAPAADVQKAVGSLRRTLVSASAVGDLEALSTRLDALGGTVTQLTEQQQAENRAAVAAAVTERTAIVDEAEQLAAQDPATTQWKQASATLDALFARWQSHQHDGPRLPKRDADDLWKRFRTARSTVESHRKAFFAELDSQHRDVRTRKTALIERAEALIPRGSDGVPAYRDLLDDWKSAGRAGKRTDDALWARFKAAGDALYAARAEVSAQENAEFSENLERKEALLVEAEPLLAEKNRDRARTALISIQRRWDEIGKVPRESVRPVEDRLRAVEAAVRKLDEDHWARSDPEKTARSQGLASQLEQAIAKLEDELAAAEATGDQVKVKVAREALDARRIWLDALG